VIIFVIIDANISRNAEGCDLNNEYNYYAFNDFFYLRARFDINAKCRTDVKKIYQCFSMYLMSKYAYQNIIFEYDARKRDLEL